MNKKKVFLTGAGQDSSYACEYFLELGYDVHVMIRRNSTPEHQESRIAHLEGQITSYYGDITDRSSLDMILTKVMPDEIYNFCAQSNVRISYDIPEFTVQVNAVGVLNLLEAMKKICPKAKMIQCSSSEMFGSSVDPDGYQRETTPFHPVSPYGCSKLFAYSIVRNYRQAFGMFASSSICFNHESSRRASNFVTAKVVKGAVMIKMGLADSLELGNLDSYRDWGHAKDYVKAIHLILQQDEPMDLVVATGETRSVREMCDYVFTKLGMDYKDYVKTNEKHFRPQELDYLRGDSTKIRELGWKPEYTFETMMDEMIDHWMDYFTKKKYF